MAKTKETLELEKTIFSTTSKMGTFGCFEVTIGFGGNERVDYLTYNTKGIWRCYEIKVSKSDFYSKAKKTFVGHYNYYVMTSELYEIVKDDIPKEIGVYCGWSLVKKPKKQGLKVSEDILKNSMIRSLYRDYEKAYKSNDIDYITRITNENTRLEKELRESKRDFKNLSNSIYYELGREKFREFRDKYFL